MNSKEIETAKASSKTRHDPGAYAAWGLLIGAVGGALLGLWLGHWFGFGVLGTGLGWLVGAFIERSRD
jgi:hypothetical protein